MNLNDLESRVQRLDQLSRGLAKETILWENRAADLQMLLDGVDLDRASSACGVFAGRGACRVVVV
jgi:hypothetical protein